MFKSGDCVVVTHNGQEATGFIDYIRGDVAFVNLTRKIDGFMHMPFDLATLKPCPKPKADNADASPHWRRLESALCPRLSPQRDD